MRKILLFSYSFLVLLSVSVGSLSAQGKLITTGNAVAKPATGSYSKVQIFTFKAGLGFSSVFSAAELELIRASGLPYKILVPDAVADYEARQAGAALHNRPLRVTDLSPCSSSYRKTPKNFKKGSMGGWLTYEEMLDNLDSMRAKYPNIITAKTVINDTIRSIEGRPIYYLKISDNPDVHEAEPEGLYTAVHHAREPGSLSQLIYYMWYLLENYNSDAEIRNLVNNTQLYFVPCLNPDGYIYNHTTNPNGGGLWRKNRRLNSDGTYGVDLNRNYGFKWGIDDQGSSPTTTSEVYRGTAPFSEPETRNIKWLCERHRFKLTLNYHTYGNDLIYPWGYTLGFQTPDSVQFTATGAQMTKENHYRYGTGDQTVAYTTNGDADDWGYGEQTTKPKSLSMTPECGTDFWPDSSEILPICRDNVYANLTLARLLLPAARVDDISGRLLSSNNNYLKYRIKRITDTVSPAGFKVSLRVLAPGSWPANFVTYPTLPAFTSVLDSLPYSLTGLPSTDTVRFVLSVDNGIYETFDTLTKHIGNVTEVVRLNCNSLPGWTKNNWGFTNTTFVSPSYSITDSPLGHYPDDDVNELYTDTTYDLSYGVRASLRFKARWDIEQLWDNTAVLVSADNGLTWTPLCGKYTRKGSGDNGGTQDLGVPLYDGRQIEWVDEEMDLDEFVGQGIAIKFRMESDQATNFDGFYVDDIVVTLQKPVLLGTDKPVGKAADMQIYPNPTAGTVSLRFPAVAGGSALVNLTDLSGKPVFQNLSDAATGSANLEVSNLPNGVYLCVVQLPGKAAIQRKLVINR